MITFGRIAGGTPESIGAMTEYLLTTAASQEKPIASKGRSQIADYYRPGVGPGGEVIPLNEKRVAENESHFRAWVIGEVAPDFNRIAEHITSSNESISPTDVEARLLSDIDNALAAAGSTLSIQARKLHGLPEPLVPQYLQGVSIDALSARKLLAGSLWNVAWMAAEYRADVAESGKVQPPEGRGIAVVRPDLHPLVAIGLDIGVTRRLSDSDISGLLVGRKTTGELIERKKYSKERVIGVNPKTNERKWATPIGSYDFTVSPSKSIALSYAFSSGVERAQIFNCHVEAAREAVAYLVSEVGQARLGDGGEDGWEQGHVAWFEIVHEQTRPVSVSTGEGKFRIEADKTAQSDPGIHTHFIVPNAVFCESGRVGSLDTGAITGFLHEVDGYYNARVATKLRESGFEAELDERTGSARMPVIPQYACDHYSKRRKGGETLAQKLAYDAGENWNELSDEQKAGRIDRATKNFRERKNSKQDGASDLSDWRQQANAIGWQIPRSFQFVGPQLPELTEEQRIRKAYDIGLPWLSQKLEHRAVVPHWDLRLAALRGLVETGCEGLTDIKKITTLMRREGVQQYGEHTAILWGQEDGKRYTSVTTALHESDESDFVRLGRGAARDKSRTIPIGLLRQKMAETGLTYTAEQVKAIEAVGTGGKFSVVVGVPGAGKTTLLTPIIAARHEMGMDVWVSSLAWRQADDLLKAGVPVGRQKAFSVLMDGIENGSIKLTDNSVVAVDEWGQLGTRQGLQLLRAQEKYRFSIISLGDDSQIGSIQAGAIFDLSRRVLGKDNIPEITVTQRQKTDREVQIARLFREGEAAEALGMKREDGTAELAYGGRQGVIRQTAKAYAERLEATGKAPTISAPTNSDAHQISEAVRLERRRMGLLEADVRPIKATDGERDYLMPLAKGDLIRLHKSTKADMGIAVRRDGRKYRAIRSIGRNGSVVEVIGFTKDGVRLKAVDGREGEVKLNDLPQHHGRTWLSYGYAWTNHISQGYGGPGHIVSLPSGSQSITGAAGYTALTRHEWWCKLITSEVAERIAVKESRPINDTHDITESDKWANVAKNFVNQRKIDSALTMMEKVGQVHRGAVRSFHNAVRPADPRQTEGPSHVGDLVQRLKLDRLVERVSRTITRVQQAYQFEGRGLSR